MTAPTHGNVEDVSLHGVGEFVEEAPSLGRVHAPPGGAQLERLARRGHCLVHVLLQTRTRVSADSRSASAFTEITSSSFASSRIIAKSSWGKQGA